MIWHPVKELGSHSYVSRFVSPNSQVGIVGTHFGRVMLNLHLQILLSAPQIWGEGLHHT